MWNIVLTIHIILCLVEHEPETSPGLFPIRTVLIEIFYYIMGIY